MCTIVLTKMRQGLNQAMDAVDELTAAVALVDKLIEYGVVLEEGTEVLNFDIKDGIGTH